MSQTTEELLLELWAWRDRAETPAALVKLLDQIKPRLDDFEQDLFDTWAGMSPQLVEPAEARTP